MNELFNRDSFLAQLIGHAYLPALKSPFQISCRANFFLERYCSVQRKATGSKKRGMAQEEGLLFICFLSPSIVSV